MDLPIYIEIISMYLSILYFKGSQVEIFLFLICVFLSLMIVIILINSHCADPGEMSRDGSRIKRLKFY